MSRIRNADESLLQFRRIIEEYEGRFAPRLRALRERYTGTPEGGLLDHSLEVHVRVYIVNALLAALNWRLNASPDDGLPNLVPEAPVRSESRKSVRFLDYLGLEGRTDDPLLLVETKRPSASLPRALTSAETYSEVLSRALGGERLTDEWSGWLDDVTDYVRSTYRRIGKAPRRAVVTNGDWLILFLDPADAFLQGGSADANRIVIFTSRADLEKRYNELFLGLEHQAVLAKAPSFPPGELPLRVRPEAVDRAMHGLRLRYSEQPGVYRSGPVIKVAPVILLRSRYGAWFRVESPPRDYELPRGGTELPAHLSHVREAAEQLLREVNRQLGRQIDPFPIVRHYEDGDAFTEVPGVVEQDRDEFLVTTGDKTHYLVLEPSVPNCPFHDWAACEGAGVASMSAPVVIRSISPRSFFFSREVHHCAHRDVNSAKASAITSANRDRCGPRSGEAGQAFCEIWRFEQHLCCRTCVFEEVCTKADVFRLPCRRPESA